VYEEILDLPPVYKGKVRELYSLDDDRLLMVATDSISAFDFVLASRIPDKGEILNRLSLWWFGRVADLVDNHVLSTDVPAAVAGRAVICERLEMIPIECVARGYLTGSGWLEYQQTGEVCGVTLPGGLVDGSRLPEPIFTPATKAGLGAHDENVSFDVVADTIGGGLAGQIPTSRWRSTPGRNSSRSRAASSSPTRSSSSAVEPTGRSCWPTRS